MPEYDANLLAALKWHARHAPDQHTRILFAKAASRILRLTKA